MVLRVPVASGAGLPGSVVVKAHLDGGPGRRGSGVAAGTDPRIADWRALADEALAATCDVWGEHPLPPAPAFRGG